MRLEIIIDSQDAELAPDAPLTLTVNNWDGDSVIGSDIPTMLRELASEMERRPQDFGHDDSYIRASS